MIPITTFSRAHPVRFDALWVLAALGVSALATGLGWALLHAFDMHSTSGGGAALVAEVFFAFLAGAGVLLLLLLALSAILIVELVPKRGPY